MHTQWPSLSGYISNILLNFLKLLKSWLDTKKARTPCHNQWWKRHQWNILSVNFASHHLKKYWQSKINLPTISYILHWPVIYWSVLTFKPKKHLYQPYHNIYNDISQHTQWRDHKLSNELLNPPCNLITTYIRVCQTSYTDVMSPPDIPTIKS